MRLGASPSGRKEARSPDRSRPPVRGALSQSAGQHAATLEFGEAPLAATRMGRRSLDARGLRYQRRVEGQVEEHAQAFELGLRVLHEGAKVHMRNALWHPPRELGDPAQTSEPHL